ncbi:MAG: hypothetical protein QG596_1292 [Actinomycetota bacterium]|jgi:hypothetical protein|nr:hypothetical protein [Actinomycetota bacterium]
MTFLLLAGNGAASPAQGFVDQYGKGSKLITISHLLQSTDAHRRVNQIELQQRRAGGWVKRDSRPVRLDAGAVGRYRLDWRYPTHQGKVETRLQLFGESKLIATTLPRLVHQPGAPFRAKAVCWGSGTFGFLGAGDWKDRRHPVLVQDLEGATNIDVGYETSYALKRGFRLLCWGTNEPRVVGKHWRINVPSRVKGLRRALQVTVEQFYGCAIRLDRRVVCWGENQDGRVGNGTTLDQLASKPVLSRMSRSGSLIRSRTTTRFIP